jgi:hypothetical protein
MVLVEEMGEAKESPKSQSPFLATPVSAPRRKSPETAEEFRELAKHLAYSVVQGYMEHDRGHLDKSAEGFFQVYYHVLPELSPLSTRRAADLYVESLVLQDEIENSETYASTQLVEDPRWNEVKEVLREFSRTLDLPDAYAEETTNFFRFHGTRDSRYVIHCLESERIFWTKVLGDGYWAKILGSLLILLTDCHDKHDSTGLEAGLQFATSYFEIILKAKAVQLHNAVPVKH